jgi:hypothetical protein
MLTTRLFGDARIIASACLHNATPHASPQLNVHPLPAFGPSAHGRCPPVPTANSHNTHNAVPLAPLNSKAHPHSQQCLLWCPIVGSSCIRRPRVCAALQPHKVGCTAALWEAALGKSLGAEVHVRLLGAMVAQCRALDPWHCLAEEAARPGGE